MAHNRICGCCAVTAKVEPAMNAVPAPPGRYGGGCRSGRLSLFQLFNFPDAGLEVSLQPGKLRFVDDPPVPLQTDDQFIGSQGSRSFSPFSPDASRHIGIHLPAEIRISVDEKGGLRAVGFYFLRCIRSYSVFDHLLLRVCESSAVPPVSFLSCETSAAIISDILPECHR